ncbi:MAG: chemotaxis protein CheA, partial [Spirochaetes bacterium]|nr:chemotaxis protein CheA [Spirochaetota bacterium]
GTLLQLARDRGARDFMRPIAEMTRLVESVREMAMVMRMVSIGPTFRKMERIARDVAAQTGKEVALVFDGEETELDKNLVKKITDPLMHVIRNAIDHGIESAEERIKAGKTAAGKIMLRARHEAGMILIEISDDGRGLDFEKILNRARERHLAEKDRSYSDAEIQQFIFLPGFSTAAQVSEVSGRGVGMDVVKKNIDMLRGSVRLSSEQGRGMTMRISLPLTLAIIDGFLVRSGTQKFVIPLDVIKECVDFRQHRRKAGLNDSRLFNLRGEVLPYIRLRDLFMSAGARTERESLIVIQQGDFRFGIVIDEPLGEYQTVIKPLTGFLAGIPGLGGATVLGSRDLALIIDVPGLIDLISEDKEIKQGTIAEAK